jgi:hypothetical protein
MENIRNVQVIKRNIRNKSSTHHIHNQYGQDGGHHTCNFRIISEYQRPAALHHVDGRGCDQSADWGNKEEKKGTTELRKKETAGDIITRLNILFSKDRKWMYEKEISKRQI